MEIQGCTGKTCKRIPVSILPKENDDASQVLFHVSLRPRYLGVPRSVERLVGARRAHLVGLEDLGLAVRPVRRSTSDIMPSSWRRVDGVTRRDLIYARRADRPSALLRISVATKRTAMGGFGFVGRPRWRAQVVVRPARLARAAVSRPRLSSCDRDEGSGSGFPEFSWVPVGCLQSPHGLVVGGGAKFLPDSTMTKLLSDGWQMEVPTAHNK